MDDKLINVIVTIIVVGVWVVQFFFKAKQEQQEQHFDEDDDEEDEIYTRPRNDYAEDPYVKVQEEIRRKIAERQAAERAASQTGRTRSAPQPPVANGRHGAPAQRQHPQQTHSQQTRTQTPRHATASVPPQPAEAMRRQEQVRADASALQPVVAVDRQLRPIPQAQLPDRAFPIAQTPAQKTVFPAAARSSQNAYHGSTKLRRTPNERNTALKAALRTAGSTRQAMLLREILGEPVALRGERRF